MAAIRRLGFFNSQNFNGRQGWVNMPNVVQIAQTAATAEI